MSTSSSPPYSRRGMAKGPPDAACRTRRLVRRAFEPRWVVSSGSSRLAGTAVGERAPGTVSTSWAFGSKSPAGGATCSSIVKPATREDLTERRTAEASSAHLHSDALACTASYLACTASLVLGYSEVRAAADASHLTSGSHTDAHHLGAKLLVCDPEHAANADGGRLLRRRENGEDGIDEERGFNLRNILKKLDPVEAIEKFKHTGKLKKMLKDNAKRQDWLKKQAKIIGAPNPVY
ncbi:unnamed protein product [Phytophthora fragariaefolia]|uniref:Unnamed protein product n=1 Tax=Phytophthora fragariaefolia TaxID=1490495 RepID=A0A9W6XH67_9STRA|nr:unnamed protein product [Phytophthora fragariaefolia]